MSIRDIIVSAVSRPAGRFVERPVRQIIDEVLGERGYAAPAEVQALRDRVAELEDLLGRLEARLAEAEGAAAELGARIERLNAPRVTACRVDGCAEPAWRDGFCRPHHHRWVSGRLEGHVGPEGLVPGPGGVAWRVPVTLAGQPFRVLDADPPRVEVGGEAIEATVL